MHEQHSDIDFQMIEVSVRLAAVHGETHFVTAWINVYGRAQDCKHVLNSSAQSGQAHSCIRPLDCGVSLAAGPYGDARTGSISFTRA